MTAQPADTYAATVAEIVELCRDIDRSNLLRYHAVGAVFSRFHTAIGSGAKNADMDRFGTDLQAQGVLQDVRDIRRFLYWAKNVYETYPDVDALTELIVDGFTVSHAKQLFALSPEDVELVRPRLYLNGRVISTRELRDVVLELFPVDAPITAAAAAVQDLIEPDPTPATVPDGGPALTPGETAPVPSEETPGNPELPTPQPEPGPVQGAQETRERTLSPKKVLGSFEKGLFKTAEQVTDVCIVIKETAQIGYDSDAAFQAYRTQLSDVKGTVARTVEVLQDLQRVMDDELGA